jgi:hypothetical protein
MTQSDLSHRGATGAPQSSAASRIAALCREIFGNGRQLVAARDRTGTWSLRAVHRDDGPPQPPRTHR